MTPNTFQAAMEELAAAYGESLTPQRVAVYLKHLGQLDDDAFRAACDRAVRDYIYKFPPVGVLLGYVREADIAAGRRFDGVTAWAHIERRILARYPDYRTADWPDPLAGEVFRAELGLPYDIARLDSDYERSRARDRFIRAYDRQRAAADAALPAPTLRAIGGGR